jgi:hypothetical protein
LSFPVHRKKNREAGREAAASGVTGGSYLHEFNALEGDSAMTMPGLITGGMMSPPVVARGLTAEASSASEPCCYGAPNTAKIISRSR